MTEKLNIVQSTTEPDKRNIWLKDNELKKFGAKGWSTIGGSNTGDGGTSTDKDALTVLVNLATTTVTVNDKQFLIFEISNGVMKINNKELYNSLVNTDIHVFIKLIGTNFNIDGYATRTFNEAGIELDLYSKDGTFVIVVYNP